jgi:hypothetical protein
MQSFPWPGQGFLLVINQWCGHVPHTQVGIPAYLLEIEDSKEREERERVELWKRGGEYDGADLFQAKLATQLIKYLKNELK